MELIRPSTINGLPPEILSEIFLAFVQTVSFDVDDGPRMLESVCRLWRDITITTPRLWASFVVVSRPDHAVCTANTLNVFLKRSGATPLTFTFCAAFTTAATHPLLERLMDHSARWKDVSLEIPLSLLPSLNRIHGRVGILHSVSLRATGGMSAITDIAAFDDAPRLEKISILGNWSSVKHIALPWSTLTSYADETGTATDPCDLASAARLEHLTFRPLHPIPEAIYLPSLKSLRVLSGACLEDFMENLSAPALEELFLDDMCLRYDLERVAPSLESLLTRSNAHIRTLRVDYLACGDAAHLMQLFRCMPELHTLEMRYWAPEELGELCRQLKQPCDVLAELETISLGSDMSGSVRDLVDLVESRWEGGGMKSLDWRYPIYDTFSLKRLKDMAEQGLE
ncbi:hypothetical protein CYLTODRAFT_488096, partial [Cylindrobasidium torrendii FP15055 ss-10]